MCAACCVNTLMAVPEIGVQARKKAHAVVVSALVRALMGNEARDPPSTRCAVLLAIETFFDKVCFLK